MIVHEHLLPLLMLTALMAAPVIALLRPRHLAWLAATTASAAMLCLTFAILAVVLADGEIRYAMGGWEAPYGIELQVGPFGALVLLLITGASTFMLLAGRQSLDREVDAARQPWFYAAWVLVVGGQSGIAVTGDAFNVFVFLEVSSLATYVLMAAGPDRRALTAVFKYLVMGTVGATFYLIGVGLLYMMTGTLNFGDLEQRLAAVDDQRPVFVAAGFITAGLGLKAALFPLHAWLPAAYTRAPHIVTAFMAACATKVAIFVLLRFDFLVFQANLPEHARQFATFVIPLALLGMIVGSAVAMFQRDLKRLLAWSSIGQIGYILLGAALVSVAGATAAVAHMFAHSLAKGTLFLAVAALALRFRRLDLSGVAGAFRAMPWTMAAFAVGAVSLIGMPGTAGFVSKWLLIRAALDAGTAGPFLVAAILLTSLMAVVYVWRIFEATGFAVAGTGPEFTGAVPDNAPRGEAPFAMLLVLWIGAAANIWFGVVTELPLELAQRAAEGLLGATDVR